MSRAGGLSRRQLLGVSGAAGAAAVAAGCGGLSSKPTTLHQVALTVDRPDIPILEELLRLEYRLAYAYTASVPRLNARDARTGVWFLHQELRHVDVISTLLKNGGVKPNTSAGQFSLGPGSNASDVFALLHGLEAEANRAYGRAIANLSNGELRAVASAIMANEAQHISILRRAQGLQPVPSALLTENE